MYLNIDAKQLAGEVRERNRLYNTLTEIMEIASESLSSGDERHDQLSKILEKCEQALANVI
jgi:hypothetical protein